VQKADQQGPDGQGSGAGDGTDSAAGGAGAGRERLVRAAYELFSREGIQAVGVDAVIARAGTAKMTLYRNFPSKDELILEFLRRREQLWTREWLHAESQRRGATPREQSLAIFDVFGEWFARPDFEGS
jgi:AcrR family transcriptional regulator